MRSFTRILALSLFMVSYACSPPVPQDGALHGSKLKVVATTTIIGDVVSNIGGGAIELVVLLPEGTDPHNFLPTPQDIAKVAEADIIFVNGYGLEAAMDDLLQSAGGGAKQVVISEGVELLIASEGDHEPHEGALGEVQQGDPHVWMDPNNVLVWVQNIEAALVAQDAENAAIFSENAEKYRQSLVELDRWIDGQVSQIPQDRRILVTDHQVLGYFAVRYGFVQVGALIPSYSTSAQPSAQDLAALQDAIKALGTPAIFVGNTVSAGLSERVASDTGTKLVFLFTDSLTGKSGPASTYVDYMRYNVAEIVAALK